MDITPSGQLPRALQAQLGLLPPPAGVALPPWAGAIEALVVAARPVATPSAGWNLEIDIAGERVQMSSATLLAAGTRLLLRALSPERVRVEQLLSEPAQLQPLRNALRSDLPTQLPLREAIGGLAMLAANPALPAPLRARIGELLAQLAHPAQLQQAAGVRAAVLNSGSFLEPRLRELLMAATATAAQAAAATPAPGSRAALAALLRLLLPARPGPATANAPVTAGPAIAPASSTAAAAVAVPLYDAQGALLAGASAVPGAAAPAPGIPAGTVPLTSAQATPATAAATMPDAAIPAAVSSGIAADLKGQLFVLLEAASGWLRARPDASRTPPPGGSLAAPGLPLYTVRGLVSGDPAPAEIGAATLPAADPMVARLAQQLAATEPARPRDPGDLVEALLRYVVGALARTRVHQLGAHPEIRRQGDSSPLQAWSVEIPIAHGGGMDALELRVEDHGRREDPRGGAERVWQVLMSLELEQIGPLHALLRLSGTRLATTLWVENPAALASARDTLAELGDCLRAEGIDVSRLECLPGAPPPRARSHDNLLDVST